MDELPKHDRKIPDSSVREIVAVINGMENIDRRILYIGYDDDGSVKVRTGFVAGPRSGRGQVVRLQLVDGGWQAELIGGWIS